MKKNNKGQGAEVKQTNNDPFLRRIEIQNTVIKKILAEIDKVPGTEDDHKNEDEMIFISLENEGKDDQNQKMEN